MPHDLSKLQGIIPPMVTPLLSPDQLDIVSLEKLIERIFTAPVAALFILGTTGEGPNLSYDLRRQLIEETVRIVANRKPILVGITDTSMTECTRLADFAAEKGIDGVVVAPPYYHKPSSIELKRWLASLAPRLSLPLFPYNMPAHTRTVFDEDTLKLAMDLPNCPGFKDSGGDIRYFETLVKLRDKYRPDWKLFIGPEHLTLEATRLGGNGGVNGGANLVPELFTDLFQAAQSGANEKAEKLQEIVLSLGRIYRLCDGESAVVRGLKAALSAAGICSNQCAEPWEALEVDQRVRGIVQSVLSTMD